MKRLRWNVLVLVLTGYLVISGMFLVMTLAEGKAPQDAYEIIEAPLMALVGGSLAIAKDLLRADEGKTDDGKPTDD